MEALQIVEYLCKEISTVQEIYREASEKDEKFDLKKNPFPN